MNNPIRLHPPIANPGQQRLNLFAGRHLSADELRLMQTYADARMSHLLTTRPPGIIEGLQLLVEPGASPSLRVQPGLAIDAQGQAIRLYFPIELDWDVLQTETGPHADGFYYLTLGNASGIVDESGDAPACTRDELDPLRDSRFEQISRLGLQALPGGNTLLSLHETRAFNRLCAAQLRHLPFVPGSVPLAMLKLVEGRLLAIDVEAGRLLSRPHAAAHALLAHWQAQLARAGQPRRSLPLPRRRTVLPAAMTPMFPAAPTASLELTSSLTDTPTSAVMAQPENAARRRLSDWLGIDYLPAAGPLPAGLLGDIAGQEQASGDWSLPQMRFDNDDLQVELGVVRTSQVEEMIERELPRGAIDLANQQHDRMRLLLAIDDQQFRADLLDLPETDHLLEQQLYRVAMQAQDDYQHWSEAWQRLYLHLDADALDASGEPTGQAVALFKQTRLLAGPDLFDQLGSSALRQRLGVPEPVPPPIAPKLFYQQLKASRGKNDQQRPRPYSQPIPDAPADYSAPNPVLLAEDGLLKQQTDLADEIDALEQELEQNFDLINAINDFASVQRQQLDAITVSFAELAGGVRGDGSGLNLMRWAGQAIFQPEPPESEQ